MNCHYTSQQDERDWAKVNDIVKVSLQIHGKASPLLIVFSPRLVTCEFHLKGSEVMLIKVRVADF